MKKLLLIFGCLVALPCIVICSPLDTTIHKYDSVDMIVRDSIGGKVLRHVVDLIVIDPKGTPPPQECACPMPSIEIKETITIAAGLPAKVVSESTPTGIKLTFYIPQGANGATGPIGATGPPGPVGPQGPVWIPCTNPPCKFFITPTN